MLVLYHKNTYIFVFAFLACPERNFNDQEESMSITAIMRHVRWLAASSVENNM